MAKTFNYQSPPKAASLLASGSLRAHAEVRLRKYPVGGVSLPPEVLVHEFRLQTIELEMLGEALHQTQLALEEVRNRYAGLYDLAPVGYLTLSHDGLITEINPAGRVLLGMDYSALLSRRLSSFIEAKDRDGWQRFMLHALHHPGKHGCKLRLMRGGGAGLVCSVDCLAQQVGETTVLRVALVGIPGRSQADECSLSIEGSATLLSDATFAEGAVMARLESVLTAANLTKAEIRVALLIRQGFPTKRIAWDLSVSPETISIHRKHIRKKLGVEGRSTNLFSYLTRLGGMQEATSQPPNPITD